MKNTGCIFCNLPQSEKIAESDLCFAMFDGFPVSKGHVLIIPKRHVADYFDLTDEEIMAICTSFRDIEAMWIIQEAASGESYRTSRNIDSPLN